MNRFFMFLFFLPFVASFLVSPVSASSLPPDSDDVLVINPEYVIINEPSAVSEAADGYLSPDQFFSTVSDYSIEVLAVQTSPNTPVTSASGLKGILIKLFGPYEPTITQLRYQSNTSTNYTYVNDIAPDYPWLASAAVFGIVLFCIFKLGGTLFCKL